MRKRRSPPVRAQEGRCWWPHAWCAAVRTTARTCGPSTTTSGHEGLGGWAHAHLTEGDPSQVHPASVVTFDEVLERIHRR